MFSTSRPDARQAGKSRRDGIAANTFIGDVNPRTAPENSERTGDYGMSGLMHCGMQYLADPARPDGCINQAAAHWHLA
jgi:hypothetical protein